MSAEASVGTRISSTTTRYWNTGINEPSPTPMMISTALLISVMLYGLVHRSRRRKRRKLSA